MLWCDSNLNEETKRHIDPHFCSKECRYFQADLLSAVQGARHESKKWFGWPVEAESKWDGLTRLSDANVFSPLISTLGMAIATFYFNVELVLRVDAFDAESLDKLQNLLVENHKRHGGRTEVRFGVFIEPSVFTFNDRLSRKCNGKLFIDASLPNLNEAFASLGETLDLTILHLRKKRKTQQKVAFHPGKCVPDSRAFLSRTKLLSVVDFFSI